MDVKGLRILGFCDWFDQRNGGGAERVAQEVWSRLARAGANIRVVAIEPGGRGCREKRGDLDVLRVRGIDLSRAVGGQWLLARGALRAARAEAAAFTPDVLHASSLHFFSSQVAASVARRTGIPMVVTSHVAGIEGLTPVLRFGVGCYEATAGLRVLRTSSRVIAVSAAAADHLNSLGVNRGTVDIVPNGVDQARFRRPTGPISSPPLVLFVGRLATNKGVDTFVEALAVLHREGVSLCAAVVGDGPLRRAIERRCRVLGISAWVELAGHQTDVAPWLRRAAVLARPSTTEGRSLALLEAMAAGVCVVASDIAANAELVSHGETGILVPARDARALAATLRSLIADPERRRTLGDAAARYAARFSWDGAAEGVATTLTAAAHRQTGAGPHG